MWRFSSKHGSLVSVLADTRELKIIIFNSVFFNHINHQLNDYGVCLLFILSVTINAISPAVANFILQSWRNRDVVDILFIVIDLPLQIRFFFFSGKDVVFRRKKKLWTFLFKGQFFYFFLLSPTANFSLQFHSLEQQRNLQPWRREDWVWLTGDQTSLLLEHILLQDLPRYEDQQPDQFYCH